MRLCILCVTYIICPAVDAENESAALDTKVAKETIDFKEVVRVDHIIASLQRKVTSCIWTICFDHILTMSFFVKSFTSFNWNHDKYMHSAMSYVLGRVRQIVLCLCSINEISNIALSIILRASNKFIKLPFCTFEPTTSIMNKCTLTR